MKESSIVRNIIVAVRKKYPRSYVRKLSDRFTRGLPDILIMFEGRFITGTINGKPSPWLYQAATLWVETKTKEGRLSEIQKLEHEKIRLVGDGCEVIVARSADEVLIKLEEMGAMP